ncbi:MAG: diaminopimelate decarboxylase [Solirubrobacteraceae bacterium]
MAIDSSLSSVFPLGSRVNDLGRLEIGGCDTIELAREFGTPAYVVAEDDLRARARAFLAAGEGQRDAGEGQRDAGEGQRDGGEGQRDGATDLDFRVVFASKAFPCSAVLSLFAEEGLWCDVASGGELHLALAAGFPPERIVLHGNAKSIAELHGALAVHVGLIVLDNFDEIERLRTLTAGGARAQDVLLRVVPDVRGETHEKISTGQANSKFGFSPADVPAAVSAVAGVGGLALRGLHAHIGSQLLDLTPFERELEQLRGLAELVPSCDVLDAGGGLGVRYVHGVESPPEIEDYVSTVLSAARELAPTVMIEPGRALVANGCVTLYTVESVKRNVSHWVAVDGGMSDNLRPMLYGAVYEAHVADRLNGQTRCVLAGKHCESGDVIVRDALLHEPRAGDVVLTPGTGAYCYAMGSSYNGVLRAPVVFCKDGDARLVVRRETLDDLTARDVR